jgi:hypothetical protein
MAVRWKVAEVCLHVLQACTTSTALVLHAAG